MTDWHIDRNISLLKSHVWCVDVDDDKFGLLLLFSETFDAIRCWSRFEFGFLSDDDVRDSVVDTGTFLHTQMFFDEEGLSVLFLISVEAYCFVVDRCFFECICVCLLNGADVDVLSDQYFFDVFDLLAKNPEEGEAFYRDLRNTVKRFKGCDRVVLGDFNAKLEKHDTGDSCIGSHSRGKRNKNGDQLHTFMLNEGMIASNTFFKHKTCHVSTFEAKRNNIRIFNQIDFILVQKNRKSSLTNARSFINNQVDTDHRLVVTRMLYKLDYETG